jgi:CheY-like chemotaxis protein
VTSGLSVLIVDDDPTSLQLLKTILEEIGLAVTIMDRPTAALRRVEAQPPDLLMTDLRMPEMNGLDLVRAVRRLDRDICCLVITGFASDEATAEAYQAGATDLLLKPVNVPEVQTRVRNAAELVGLRREVKALRAALGDSRSGAGASHASPRAQELAALPALPGSAAPLDVLGRDEILHRLARIEILHRQGILTAAEYEEKKRSLLDRL